MTAPNRHNYLVGPGLMTWVAVVSEFARTCCDVSILVALTVEVEPKPVAKQSNLLPITIVVGQALKGKSDEPQLPIGVNAKADVLIISETFNGSDIGSFIHPPDIDLCSNVKISYPSSREIELGYLPIACDSGFGADRK